MDKRFIIMFFILIAGIFNLFFISEYSDVIGSASVDVSNYTFSLPEEFVLLNTNNAESISIYNSKSGLHIMVSVIHDYNSSYKINQLNNDSRYDILSNGTINIGNKTIDSIYYNDVNIKNKSSVAIFYFNKFNATFKVNMDNFDYETQRNETIDAITDIVTSLRINYKVI